MSGRTQRRQKLALQGRGRGGRGRGHGRGRGRGRGGRGRGGNNGALVPHSGRQQPRQTNAMVPRQSPILHQPNAIAPYKARPKRSENQLVAYKEPLSEDEYEATRQRPWGAQFCEPRCFLLLLLILFFGLMLLVFIIMIIMSVDKGDPPNIAGWSYLIPARGPDGEFISQFGENYGTAITSAGEFMAVTAPNRENPNGSSGAVFLYVWLGSMYAVYGKDGVIYPPDPDYEPKTWLPFAKDSNTASREEKEKNRIHFDNTSPNAIKWADDGSRVMIGIPGSSSVVVYEFTHPLKESDYIASIIVGPPYQEGGRDVAVSKDGNRVALTARYNQTLDQTIDQTTDDTIRRWLNDTKSTNCTDIGIANNTTTNCADAERPLPGVVQFWDFYEPNKTWVQNGMITGVGDATVTGDWGTNMVMSLDGLTIAVANPTYNETGGLVQVFRVQNSTSGIISWSQVGEDIRGKQGDGNFGFSMGISEDGDTIAVGSPLSNEGNGTAYVYELKTGGSVSLDGTFGIFWDEKAFFKGNETGELLGYSIDINEDGNSIVVGSPMAHGGIGKMTVFDFSDVLELWFPYVDLPQRDQYGNYDGHGSYGSSVVMTNNGDSIFIGAPNTTDEKDGSDYVTFFDKAPKGMDLTGRKRPDHVLLEHEDDEFGSFSAGFSACPAVYLSIWFAVFSFVRSL